jgi:hypothetical protein
VANTDLKVPQGEDPGETPVLTLGPDGDDDGGHDDR